MYTVIKAQIVDQTLSLVSVPTLASGGVNEIRLECEFCSLWDDLGKVATFYRDKDNVYHVPLVAGACIVPHEVTDQEGTFWLGVFGSGDNTVRTSEVVQLTVEQGAITQGTDPAEPTPDVYTQILAHYGQMDQGLAELSARMDTLVQSHGTGGTQTQTLTTTEFNKNGEDCTIEVTTDGIHAWIKVLNVNLSIAAGQEVTLYQAYEGMRPIAYVEMCIYNGIAFGVSRGTDNAVNVSFRNTTNATASLEMFAISGVYPLDAPSLAELNDLRVGYDGTTYETAGAAVRAQIAALHGQGGGDGSGGGSGTITPPALGDPEYLIVNGYMGLSEAKKALARRNIDAVASVNGRTPDENGNVDLTTLIPPSVDSGGGVTDEQIAAAVEAYFAEHPAVRVAEVELIAANWTGDTSPYSQIVNIPGITQYSQVDLTPSVEQLAISHDKDLAFVTENEDGVVTVYAIGDKPQNDYTMQVTIKEVSV